MLHPRVRALLVALLLATVSTLLTTSGIAAGGPASSAQFSQSATSTVDRQMFGPELMGRVTKAGKVGNINANVGDLVLREARVPGGRGARVGLGPATVQAATVLHGQHIRTIDPPNTFYNYRQVAAIEENQSNQVRGYNKGHMFADSVVSTYHGSDSFFVWNWDYDSAGDGCGPYPSGDPCLYAKNPTDANTKVLDYYILGTYRHKCGQAGWNCNNTWWTQTEVWWWNDPYLGDLQTGITCSYKWNVLYGQGAIGCNDG